MRIDVRTGGDQVGERSDSSSEETRLALEGVGLLLGIPLAFSLYFGLNLTLEALESFLSTAGEHWLQVAFIASLGLLGNALLFFLRAGTSGLSARSVGAAATAFGCLIGATLIIVPIMVPPIDEPTPAQRYTATVICLDPLLLLAASGLGGLLGHAIGASRTEPS